MQLVHTLSVIEFETTVDDMNPNETYTREETDEKGAFWLALRAKATEGPPNQPLRDV